VRFNLIKSEKYKIMNYSNLKNKVKALNGVLKNTKDYRKAWDNGLKEMIVKTLEELVKKSKMKAKVEIQDQISGMEAISLALGVTKSGINERVSEKVEKPLIRMNGVLIFQQLFNGKLSIWINYPYIEGVGDPKTPKMLEIVRPNEINPENVLLYTEQFIDEIIGWEDYDDDLPPQPASPGIGFNHQAASLK